MSEIITLDKPTAVPSFDTVDELCEALEAKYTGRGDVDLYPRDGGATLCGLEERFAEYARVEADELTLCSSGMAAVVCAIESCRQQGAVIAASGELYSQTQAYFARLNMDQGVQAAGLYGTEPASIEASLNRLQPSIIFAETVGNALNNNVLNIEALIGSEYVQEKQPYIILDHTLPLSTGRSLRPYMQSYQRLIGVESGTKAYTANTETSGLVYTRDEAVQAKLRETRRMYGFTPSHAQLWKSLELLPVSVEAFDERNERICRATAQLAIALADVECEVPFYVSSCYVPSHDDFDVAERLYDGKASPVLFLQPFSGKPKDGVALAEKLWSHAYVMQHAELGQSFAFDKTRILTEGVTSVVRIAGGAQTDGNALGEAFQEALCS